MLFLTKAIFVCLVNQAMSAFFSGVSAEKLNLYRAKRQISDQKNVDVLFLLDETVEYENFARFLRFTDATLSHSFCGVFSVGEKNTRVAFATFSSTVTKVMDFHDHFSVKNARANIVKLGTHYHQSRHADRTSVACIENALEFSAEDIFTTKRGARVGDSNARGLIVLLTQGCDNCNATSLNRTSAVLGQNGIALLSLPVTSSDQCLMDMALLASGSACSEELAAMSWCELNALASSLESSTCIPSWIPNLECTSIYREKRLWLWSEWGACSVTCGRGLVYRSRKECQADGLCSKTTASKDCFMPTCRPTVCTGEWTIWFDRDDPEDGGDYETLSSFRRERKLDVCISPSEIDARVVGSRVEWSSTRENLSISPSSGLTCIEKNQTEGRYCSDYEVRFCCPKIEDREEVLFVAETFAQTILTVGAGAGTSQGGSSQSQGDCEPRSFSSPSSNVRMIGKVCKSGRQKRQAPQNNPPITKRDVLFLIDESGSVGDVDFEKFKRLAKAFVNNTFCGDIGVGENMTRVGILSFDSAQHPHLNFNDTFDKDEVLEKIDAIGFDWQTAGYTCLIPTLKYVRTDMFSPARGARIAEPGTEQVLILLSDGCANCEPSSKRAGLLMELADKFRQADFSIITFVVGPVTSDCVKQFSSLAAGAHCYETFQVDDWSIVDAFADSIENSSCTESWSLSGPC